MSFDEAGWRRWPCDDKGARLAEEEVCELEPALQIQVRARAKLGAQVKVMRKQRMGRRKKLRGTHVNLDVQRGGHGELCEWQAKLGFTAVYATDGTRREVERVGAKGKTIKVTVVAKVAVRHCGREIGGTVEEVDGRCNYGAEVA
eukprot:6663852-Prymnesium_polylepis.1